MSGPGRHRSDLADQLHTAYLRALALVVLAMGLHYWASLLGIPAGASPGFDAMPTHWRVATAVLAVLLPTASIGLWMAQSWGLLLWLLAAGGEVVMHLVRADLFGRNDVRLIYHGVTLVLVLVLEWLRWRSHTASRPGAGG